MSSTKQQMSKWERVEAAMNLQETDRTPVYDILVNDATIEYLTGKFPPVGEEGLKLRLQATEKIIDMTRMVGYGPQEPGEFTDKDGFVHYREDRWIGGGLRKRPFSDEEGAKRWLVKAIKSLREERIDLKKYAENFRNN